MNRARETPAPTGGDRKQFDNRSLQTKTGIPKKDKQNKITVKEVVSLDALVADPNRPEAEPEPAVIVKPNENDLWWTRDIDMYDEDQKSYILQHFESDVLEGTILPFLRKELKIRLARSYLKADELSKVENWTSSCAYDIVIAVQPPKVDVFISKLCRGALAQLEKQGGTVNWAPKAGKSPISSNQHEGESTIINGRTPQFPTRIVPKRPSSLHLPSSGNQANRAGGNRVNESRQQSKTLEGAKRLQSPPFQSGSHESRDPVIKSSVSLTYTRNDPQRTRSPSPRPSRSFSGASRSPAVEHSHRQAHRNILPSWIPCSESPDGPPEGYASLDQLPAYYCMCPRQDCPAHKNVPSGYPRGPGLPTGCSMPLVGDYYWRLPPPVPSRSASQDAEGRGIPYWQLFPPWLYRAMDTHATPGSYTSGSYPSTSRSRSPVSRPGSPYQSGRSSQQRSSALTADTWPVDYGPYVISAGQPPQGYAPASNLPTYCCICPSDHCPWHSCKPLPPAPPPPPGYIAPKPKEGQYVYWKLPPRQPTTMPQERARPWSIPVSQRQDASGLPSSRPSHNPSRSCPPSPTSKHAKPNAPQKRNRTHTV